MSDFFLMCSLNGIPSETGDIGRRAASPLCDQNLVQFREFILLHPSLSGGPTIFDKQFFESRQSFLGCSVKFGLTEATIM